MFDKKQARIRRGAKTRYKIKDLRMPRLAVYKSAQHIYAQLIIDEKNGSKVVASASTLCKALRDTTGNKVERAVAVGKLIAQVAKAAGYEKVAFDRSGFKYHGRIKALADAAREGGLQF